MSEPLDLQYSYTLEQWREKWLAYKGPVQCYSEGCTNEVEESRRPPDWVRPMCFSCMPPIDVNKVEIA